MRVKTFKKPTIEEVTKYCQERSSIVKPQVFLDYYEARGWKLNNGAQIKSWEACVRTWENRHAEQKKEATQNVARDY